MLHPTPRAFTRSVHVLYLCLAALAGMLTLAFGAPSSARAAGVIFVRSAATGANSGTSWADAYTSLPPALSAASSGDQVWVAAGTYAPTTTTDRTASFVLKSGVAVYGGFAGSETQLSQRNWAANVTTLSGDIGAAGVSSDNSYHVVTGATGATLDGFTISGGNANGSGSNASGGGFYNSSASPTLSNLIISGNSVTSFGGGIYNTGSSPTLINVTISGNTSTNNSGAGIYNTSSSPTLTNVTISGNTSGRRRWGV